MDFIEFFTENREYKIRVTKTLRSYTISNYGKYKITIDFINTLDQVILSINTTEKEYYQALSSLSSFTLSAGSNNDDIIPFNNIGDGSKYFIYISLAHPYYIGPLEDDDIVGLSIYHSSQQGNALRLYIELTFYFLEDMVYNMFQIIEDIPYINEIMDSSFFDFLDCEILNYPD